MSDSITDFVRSKYGAVAQSQLGGENAQVQAVAEAFGYSASELASIPADANMGLSCGNPIAFASLKAGEVVVDLGCGGGIDAFLAAQKVGPFGKAIGIDMTPEMIDRAKANAQRTAADNVEFHLASIDQLPLADSSVDCIISNCVINLAPDKSAVFREIYRVLKPGGRVAISDIALKQSLPKEIAEDLLAYVGCVARAILMDDYRAQLVAAGFSGVQVIDSGADLNAYSAIDGACGCCSSPAMDSQLPLLDQACAPSETVHGGLAELLSRYDVNQYAASVKVFAVK